MSIHVVWNTLKDPGLKVTLEKAVIEALAHRPKDEHWDVKLTESEAVPGWTAVITGPNRMNVAWYFHGPGEEDSPEQVRARLEALLKAVGW